MGHGERRSAALHDRVDRAGGQLDAEQLARELGRVAARDTVSDRERDDRRLQAGPERRPRQLAGKLGPSRGRALRAADAVQPMLAHAHRDRRQLCDLVAPRLHRINKLLPGEHVRAGGATLGPMLHDLVNLLRRKQPPVLALVPGLAARRPT